MINAIVVLIMIEMPIMMMKDITMDIMILLGISITIYFLNIIQDTPIMIVFI